MLALGLDNGRVMLVDEATGEERWAVQAHSKAQTQVVMSPGTCRIVASVGLNDEHWKLWDTAGGAVHRVGATHDGTGTCVCFFNSHRERWLNPRCPMVAHTSGIFAVTFSPCGKRLATGGKGGVIVWDAETGVAEHRTQGDGAASSLTFSADGARLAGNPGGFIHLWNATTGTLLDVFGKSMNSVRFSPMKTEDRKLACCGEVFSLLWDVQSNKRKGFIKGRKFASFSPDGRDIAFRTTKGPVGVQLVRAKSRVPWLRIVCHAKCVHCATFSVDGRKLATGGVDGTCKVWNSSTGALVRTINVGNPVRSVAWERDWFQDAKLLALAMGQHPRLGAGSQLLGLDAELLRMIQDLV